MQSPSVRDRVHSNYDKHPAVAVSGWADSSWRGWDEIARALLERVGSRGRRFVLVVECYPGTLDKELLPALRQRLQPDLVIESTTTMLPPQEIDRMLAGDLTDDPVFGRITQLRLEDFFDADKLRNARQRIDSTNDGLVLIYGTGAALIADADLLVYADLARWEIQQRFRRDAIANLGAIDRTTKASLQYKRAFFVDWRVCDHHKKRLFDRIDFFLDTNIPDDPKMAAGDAVRDALRQTASRPFRVVPFFDPAPWGGQWMKQVCDLDRATPNFGWCFDCVPEENSLLLDFAKARIEIPSIDLIFYQPRELLGETIYRRFGDEFPIRFDFLDTMGGGNLSLQVHPLTESIQRHFGMRYTQDESYYLLDAGGDASVYLGLRDGIDPAAMARDLEDANAGRASFDAEKYVNKWPAKKHDHFLIPAGTIHCSGANSMVLEISATPYIFTFKLWDWGRPGLDGLPRPVHLNHGLPNIQWDRTTDWTRQNLINRIEPIAEGDGWREERTGLHALEFIEARRHWFSKTVPHHTRGTLNVLNLIEGREAIIESPDNAFGPLIVHYAESFIVPAAAGAYTIRPHGPSQGLTCATIKASVRE